MAEQRETVIAAARTADASNVADSVAHAFRRLLSAQAVLLLVSLAILVYVLAWLRPEQQRYQAGSHALAMEHAGMLDQETGLRGYLLVRQPRFLQPYYHGIAAVARENAELDRDFGSDSAVAPALLEMRLAQQAWTSQWASVAASPATPSSTTALARFLSQGKALFDVYRAKEVALAARVESRRNTLYARQTLAFAIGLGAVLVFGVILIATMLRQRDAIRRTVLGPVETIVAAMERIADGQLEHSLEAEGAGEFRRIAHSVNTLREALAEARSRDRSAQELIEAQAGQLRSILTMSREIAGSLHLGYVLRSVALAATTVSGFPRAIVWLRHDGDATALDAAFDTLAEGPPRDEPPAEVGVGVLGHAVRYGRVTSETEGEEPTVEVHPERGLRSLAVPLVVGAQVTGAIELSSREPHKMIDGSLEILQTLASHAAAAIEAARLHGKTEELAQTDGLTGAFNRRRLDVEIAAECERSERYGRPLALIMFDVDHFKAFNDSFGHVRGDEILQELAELARREIRTTDTLYRYGGEEFAVITRETDAEDAKVLAERLRARVEAHFAARGSPRTITASFGVGCVPPEKPTPESVIASADAALYRAKLEGRNRVCGPVADTAASPAAG